MSCGQRPQRTQVALGTRRQRLQHPGRHRQRLGQPDGEPRPAPLDLPDGRPGVGEEPVPVEHRRPADLVHHPREPARLHRPQEGNRLPRRDEPETAKEDVLSLEPGARRRLRRAAEAQRAAQRPDVLSGAVRQDRRRGLPGREAAPPRQEHDLRRRPGRSCSSSSSARWRRRSRKQLGKKPKAMRAQHGARSRPGRKFTAEHLAEARSVSRRADEQDRRQDPDRRQRRRRHGLHVGRRHRRRLVSDHAVLVAARDR